jgi:hypothetical protein
MRKGVFIMREFTNIIKYPLLRLATIISTLLVGMTLVLTTSAASAAVIKHVNIDNNKDVIEAAAVKAPVASKVEVEVVKPEAVKVEAVKPEQKSKFIRPFGFRPFINDEFFGFGE